MTTVVGHTHLLINGSPVHPRKQWPLFIKAFLIITKEEKGNTPHRFKILPGLDTSTLVSMLNISTRNVINNELRKSSLGMNHPMPPAESFSVFFLVLSRPSVVEEWRRIPAPKGTLRNRVRTTWNSFLGIRTLVSSLVLSEVNTRV